MEFQVHFIGDMDQRLKELALEAVEHGQDLFVAYDRMVPRPRRDPLAKGEALYHLSNGEPAHHFVDSPLSMWFVVHVAFRQVWICRLDRLAASDESPPEPL